MIRDLVQRSVSEAVARLQSSGALPASLAVPVEIADPKDPSHGDFACSWALAASKPAGKNPRELAEMLKKELESNSPSLEGGVGVGGQSAPTQASNPSDLVRPSLEGGVGVGGQSAPTQASNPSDLVRPSLEGGAGVGDLPAQNALRTAETSAESGGQATSTPQPPPSKEGELFSSIEVAGPGFLNLRLTDAAWLTGATWANARAQNLAKPQHSTLNAQHLNVEFVSVNPNGPITVGSGRGAAFGSTLCNVLEAVGHQVHREYYINDGTNSEQMRMFAESLRLHSQLGLGTNVSVEKAAYRGDFVRDAATGIRWATKAHVEKMFSHQQYLLSLSNQQLKSLRAMAQDQSLTDEERAEAIGAIPQELYYQRATRSDMQLLAMSLTFIASVEGTLEDVASKYGQEVLGALGLQHFQDVAVEVATLRQREDLTEFGVTFDTWFSEQSLHDSGKVAEAIAHLQTNGAADEKPERRKLKLAKGGVIEDVEIEVQPGEEDEEETNDKRETTDDEPDSSRIAHRASPSSDSETANRQLEDPAEGKSKIGTPTANPTLWLRSTKFGDDMDRVLRRKDGRLTYISSDVAYHQDKFERGSKPNQDGRCERADKLITILGPDHHGYIARLHAVLAASEVGKDETHKSDKSHKSYSPLTDIESKLYASAAERDACQAALATAREELEVVIFQIVRFVKEGKPSPMRKRDGNIYSLKDLMSEIGKDAAPNASPEDQIRTGKDVARFFYLMRSHDTHMDFDIDLATKGTEENPVFYVQYAHARICSILEKAGDEGKNEKRKTKNDDDSEEDHSETADGQRLTANDSETANDQQPTTSNNSPTLHPKEISLIKKILDLPDEVARCAEDYGVHRLTTYAIELARTFHHFYDACRVIQPENPDLQAQRIELCKATRHALKGALDLLGVSAPTRMEREPTAS